MTRLSAFASRAAAVALLGAFALTGAHGQVATAYTFSQSSGSFALTNSGGTVLWSNALFQTFDDQVSGAIGIPDFNFNGTVYTQMYVSANGFITFGSAPAGGNYTPISNTATYSGAVSAFGADIRSAPAAITANSDVRVFATGTEVVVQWRNVRRYLGGANAAERFSFQIRLNWDTGVIKVVYSGITSQNTGTTQQPEVGLRGPNNTFATNVNNRLVGTGAENWNTSLAGTANNSICRFTSAAPAKGFTNGQTYTWTPCTPTVSISPVAPALCAGGSVALNASGTATSFSWSPGTGLSGVTGATVTASPAATTYYTLTGSKAGCPFTSSVTFPVLVKQGPSAMGASASSYSVCQGGTVDLTATATAPSHTAYSWDFSTGAGWTQSNTSTGGTPANANWYLQPDGHNPWGTAIHSNDNSQFALTNSDAQGSGGTTNTELISPVFHMAGYTTMSLNFYHYYRDLDGTDFAYVDVSTNGGATWTQVQAYSSTQGAPAAFAAASINLNAYAGGTNLRVRFRYTGVWAWGWAIDNVSITGGSPINAWSWSSTPSGYSSSVQNPTGAPVPSTRTFTVTATAANGCMGTATTPTVTWHPLPTATLAGNGPFCGNGSPELTGTLTGTGPWSITYTTNGGSPTTVNGITSSPFTINPAGPITSTTSYAITAVNDAHCAAASLPGAVSVEVAVPATATVGGDQSICPYTASAGLGGNAPSAPATGAWSVVSGGTGTFSPDASTPNATFTHTGGTGPIVLRWTITNPPCAPSTADVTLTLGCTYYSRATGDVVDPIWSPTPNGPAGPAIWGNVVGMVVQGGDVVTNTADVTVKNVAVDAGGTLVLGTGATLKVTAGTSSINGTLTAQDGSGFSMSEGTSATLAVAGNVGFHDFTVGMTAGVTVTGGIRIRGTLQLDDGVFDCTGADVMLRSTATYQGRLGPVGATASYQGNMTVQRYIPGGATNWRLLGSPIQGRSVMHWQDDFFTAGYPGSHYPNFYDPPGSGILWPSIRWYDETNTGAAALDGLVGVSGHTQSLVPGQGFAAWCGDNLGGTAPFTIDLDSNAPVIASSPIVLPMSYTDTGNPTADGWNLVANPLPSAIDFAAISRGADVDDYVTFYDPASGNTAVYDLDLGFGTNGATPTIQSMQGFFLKATGPSVTTTVVEADKVDDNAGGFFGGSGQSAVPALRVRISSAINSYSDEAGIVFHQGSPGLDAADVLKYVLATPAAPQIASLMPTGDQVAINAYGSLANGLTVPLSVKAGVTGQYTISIAEQGDLGLTCITLEDLETGAITPMNDGATYSFQLETGADPSVARFILHATPPALLYAEDATCGGTPNGQATVVVQGGPSDITWQDSDGAVLLVQQGVEGGVAIITGLGAGSYTVSVGSGACGALAQGFAINAPFVLEAQADATDAACADAEGHIDLLVLGGTAPYSFAWDDAAATATEDLTALPGSYTVTVTDANGCTWTSEPIAIGNAGPAAEITGAPATALVGEPVQFHAGQADADYFWSFGDGATSEEQDPVHAYALPGTYTVVLSVDNGQCQDAATADITVEMSTGIAEAAPAEHRAWATPQGIVVIHAFGTGREVRVELMDATGRMAVDRRMPGERTVLPADGLANGVWFVRLSSGNQMATLRVPLAR